MVRTLWRGREMTHYDAFLVRIWRTGTAGEGHWAIRLEHLPDGQRAPGQPGGIGGTSVRRAATGAGAAP